MRPIDSTPEILMWKHLNKSVDEKWKDWAYEMLKAGFDSEHLIELAGIEKPFNQFELQDLTSKVFDELNLDYSNAEKVVDDYIYFLISQVLENKRDILLTLRRLYELCIALNYPKNIYDFYLLYFAKEDLNYTTYQHYWPEGDRENIDIIILDYFRDWKNKKDQV